MQTQPVALSAAMVACVVWSSALALYVQQAHGVEAVEGEWRKLNQQSKELGHAGVSSADVKLSLPAFNNTQLLEALKGSAENTKLTFDEVSFVLDPSANQPYLRYRATLTVTSQYPTIRKFLDQVRGKQPEVSLDSILCTRDDITTVDLTWISPCPRFTAKTRMAKGVNWRWVILLSLTAVTAVASFYPTDSSTMASPVRNNKRATQAALPSATVPADVQSADVVENGVMDPFAPRGWEPPPPPPPVPVKVVAVAAAPVAPPAPVGPPPLPFKFMGAMNDDGTQVIYLSHGDNALVAHVGETLESAYKVLVVDGQHIEFEHLPTGEKQTLTIPVSDN